MNSGDCYNDYGHVLIRGKADRLWDDNSIEACIAHCEGYKFAGLGDGSACHCGNTAPPSSNLVPPGECNYKCPGNQSQNCGGAWRMNIYHLGKKFLLPFIELLTV